MFGNKTRRIIAKIFLPKAAAHRDALLHENIVCRPNVTEEREYQRTPEGWRIASSPERGQLPSPAGRRAGGEGRIYPRWRISTCH